MFCTYAYAYFKVAWAHENVCNAFSHDSHDPFVEVSRRYLGQSVGHFGFDKSINALNLFREYGIYH